MKKRGRPPGSKNKAKRPFDDPRTPKIKPPKVIDAKPVVGNDQLKAVQDTPAFIESGIDLTAESKIVKEAQPDTNPGFELPPELYQLMSKLPELQHMLDPIRLGSEVATQVKGFFDGPDFKKLVNNDALDVIGKQVAEMRNEIASLRPKKTVETLLNKPWF